MLCNIIGFIIRFTSKATCLRKCVNILPRSIINFDLRNLNISSLLEIENNYLIGILFNSYCTCRTNYIKIIIPIKINGSTIREIGSINLQLTVFHFRIYSGLMRSHFLGDFLHLFNHLLNCSINFRLRCHNFYIIRTSVIFFYQFL